MFGVDYATVTPDVARVKDGGAGFVCRYLSTLGNPKNLTPAEASALRKEGVHIVTVFETVGNRALAGYAAGKLDAGLAFAQGVLCGMLTGDPIYFAVDFDASPGQQAAINAYLVGVASRLGKDRVGVYGSYYVVKRALDAGVCKYGWQTYAWSGGQWDPRAHIRQFRNGQTFAGLSVDFDQAMFSDFGQWKTPGQPLPPTLPDAPPHPEPKNQPPFITRLWPRPVPAWFWTWVQWRRDGKTYARPANAPLLIPPWAWARLKAL